MYKRTGKFRRCILCLHMQNTAIRGRLQPSTLSSEGQLCHANYCDGHVPQTGFWAVVHIGDVLASKEGGLDEKRVTHH
jgi:hypothetical protein